MNVIKAGKYEFPLGKKTYIMGILNVTPDSFSDGGSYIDVDKAVEHAARMIEEGADIIDIGGESTRPGSLEVTLEEELRRVIPVIERLNERLDIAISIDTYKAEVAEAAIKAGAHMINDVWGMQRDSEMAKVAAKYKVPVFVMHNQVGTSYDGDLVEAMLSFFKRSIQLGEENGIDKSQIIIDPGFGFGKTPAHNIEVMRRLNELNVLNQPILLGTSRKSTIGLILDLPPSERVEGTLATAVIGIMNGVDFVRVHDVKEHARALKVTDAIIRSEVQNGLY